MEDQKKQQNSNESNKEASFEASLNELEKIVELLEAGDAPLEEAIRLFQRGMTLSKTCHQKLQIVEKQVHMLIEENGELIKKEYKIEEDTRE